MTNENTAVLHPRLHVSELLSRNDNFRFIEGQRMIILPRKCMSSTIDVMMVFLNVSHV